MVHTLLTILLPLVCLPGILNLSESDPPVIEPGNYILEQSLPGFTLDQVEEWFLPVEDYLVQAPEIASLELSILPGRGILQVTPRTGKNGPGLRDLLERTEAVIRNRTPEQVSPGSFFLRSREDAPWLLTVYGDAREAESAKSRLEREVRGIGEIKLFSPSPPERDGQKAPGASFPFHNESGDPYPWLSAVQSFRMQRGMGGEHTYLPGSNSASTAIIDSRGYRERATDRTFLDGKAASLLSIYPGEAGTISLHQKCVSILTDTGVLIYNGAEELIGELKRTLGGVLIGVLVVGLLIFLSQKRLSEYGAILFVLPFSLVPSLSVLGYSNGSIHILNLTALACCSGTLIDGTVLVIEELRYNVTGAGEASWMGTATTIVSFLPLALLPPPIGTVVRHFAPIPVTAMFISILYNNLYLPSRLSRITALPETGRTHSSLPSFLLFLLLPLLFPPFLLLPLSPGPRFSNYGMGKKHSIQSRILFPETLPLSVAAETIPGIESLCKHHFPEHRSLIFQEKERITIQLIPPGEGNSRNMQITGPEQHLFRQELAGAVAPLGGTVQMASVSGGEVLRFHIMESNQEKRQETAETVVRTLRVLFPQGEFYSNEIPLQNGIEMILRPALLFSSGYFPHLVARELSWRIGGGGIVKGKEIYPAGLDDLDLLAGDFHPFLHIGKTVTELSRFRRNGLDATTISLHLANRIDPALRKALLNMERQLSRDFPGMIEWTPELKKMEEITIQAVQGAAASLLSILLLLIFLYNGVLKPLLILFPVLSGLAWSMVLLAWADIPLTLPGTGALFFSAGIGVNTGLLLLPRRERRGGEGLSLSALLVPILTTLGGIAPLLFLSTGASLDLPVIILVTTIVSTLGALGVSSLHGCFTPPQAIPPGD